MSTPTSAVIAKKCLTSEFGFVRTKTQPGGGHMVQDFEKRICISGQGDGTATLSFDSPAGTGCTDLVTWKLSLVDHPSYFFWGYPDDLLQENLSNMTGSVRTLFRTQDSDLANQTHYDEM